MKKPIICTLIAALLAPALVLADADDFAIFGVEAEKLFNLGSGVLSTILFALTLTAYLRTKKIRLLFVSIAFFLFAIKGYLGSSELFFGEWTWVDPIAAILNFAILLCFFQGIMKK